MERHVIHYLEIQDQQFDLLLLTNSQSIELGAGNEHLMYFTDAVSHII